MANRPRVNGWENINQNKPAEYSSEFTIDGNRYANVTNVRTGQRQLYLVSGLGGTAFTQRSLITSTNADGTVTKGGAYDSFVRTYGANKLTNAERENKKQSNFIIKKASTEEEKNSLSSSNQYKNLENTSKKNPDSVNNILRKFTLDTTNISQGSPLKGKNFVTYPVDITSTKQDRIKFTAATLKERNLSSPTDYMKIPGIGDVYISIQGSIVDQNAASWGESELGAGKLAMADIATGGGSQAKNLLNDAMGSLTDQNTKDAIIAGAAAGDMSLFTRATSKVFNPNIELLFNKPQLRSFNFNFKMSARNEEEATAIKEIIRFFKFHSAVKDEPGFLFLKSPDVFWIEYQKGKGDLHQSLNLIAPGKIKKKACALQNMSVNYTPLGSYMTFDDEQATMVQYDLTLTFQEISPIFQSDYDEVKDHPIGY